MRVYIGWDSREEDAYDACVNSICHNNKSNDVEIFPIKQEEVESRGLYQRRFFYPREQSSTEFAFTRFLTPRLAGYEGWAIFCDCDFIWTRDIQELWSMRDHKYAVMVVKHDYTPRNSVKMDNQPQIAYPRKNWSSMMMFNCEHPSCAKLNPRNVSEQTGAWLHRMKWCEDNEIGEVPLEWNWLEGEYDKPDSVPAVIHYTQGGPWMKNHQDVDFVEEYWKYARIKNDNICDFI